jgi:glycosyltransferase involved in cell wall biosynthesis
MASFLVARSILTIYQYWRRSSLSFNNHRVSIGLPVYNGENYVREAIESILSQTFEDFELIISDNASTDQTEEICRSYAIQDERIRYFRNQENLGASSNYKRVFDLASGEFFKWAAHDDLCLPGFVSRCVEVLDHDPTVVLCYARTITIDSAGKFAKKWDARPEFGSEVPHRRFREVFVPTETFPIWGLIRTNILRKTPLLGNYPEHDLPLLTELSLYGRFYEIPEFLFLSREHKQRSVRTYDFRKPHEAVVWYDPKMSGKIIFPAWRLFSEHIASINRAPLSLRERIPCYSIMARWFKDHRQALLRDLIFAGARIPVIGQMLTKTHEKYLESKWLNQTKRAVKDLESIVAVKENFILVDEVGLDPDVFARWEIIPFPERDGNYSGPPPDDATAISELNRLRIEGADFIVFVWATFWWLDYYSEFNRHLRSKFRCVVENDRLVVFDLRRDSRK